MPFNEVLKNCSAKPWLIGNSEISGNPVPAIMGILNLTPDSFFDGGLHASYEEGIAFAKKLLEDGANIIDIGGESSRPGAIPVSAKDEIVRILPVIKALTAMSLEKPFFISIDTTKTEVAIAALQAGAHIINDVSMLSEKNMAQVIKDFNASVVLNHRRGNFSTMQKDFSPYQNVVEEVRTELNQAAEKLRILKIPKEKICLDPGIGFGKTPKDNFELIANAEFFLQDGYPLLYGMSRKSYIGKVKELETSNRLIPTITSGILATLGGVTVLRVHDVKETKESLALLEAFRNDGAIYSI